MTQLDELRVRLEVLFEIADADCNTDLSTAGRIRYRSPCWRPSS